MNYSNYDSRFNFNKYSNIENFDRHSFISKTDRLKEFHDKLKQFKSIKSTKKKIAQKKFLCDDACDLYNSLLANCEQQYSNFSDEKSKIKRSKHNFSDLLLDEYGYNNYFDEEPKAVKEESDDLPRMSPVEGDGEKPYRLPFMPLSKSDKKEQKGLKILT